MNQLSEIPNSDGTFFDLTQSQFLMWTGQQLNPGSPLYNMALTFELAGPIEVKAFQDAFQALVDRSDAMRTTFLAIDEAPQQQVLSKLQYSVSFLDWTTVTDPDTAWREWVETRSRKLFDLSSCCFDSVLLKFTENRFFWFLNQHHLITDAWSGSVQCRTMAALYQHALAGRLETAPALPAFNDFIAFEKANRTALPGSEIFTYWQEITNQLPPTPSLYGQINKAPTSLSKRITLDLGEERSARLRDRIQDPELRSWTPHLSLFNIFATTLFAYLYRVSGQRTLAIGTPAHNRPTVGFKETPGVFIEIFPLLTEIEEEESFIGLLRRVRLKAHEFLRNAQPGAGTPEMSRRFNVILNYIHTAFSGFGDIPMQSNWIHPGHCDPHHHLRLQVEDFDDSGKIRLHFDLNEHIFEGPLRVQAPGHFLCLLDAFLKDYNQAIDLPGLVSPTDYQPVASSLDKSKAVPPQKHSVVDFFREQARKAPEAPALFYKEQVSSYQDLDAQSNQLARHLIQRGIGPDNRIGIYLKRSPTLLISIWGVLKSGAAFVPIPSEYPTERVTKILEDAGVSLLLTESNLANRLKPGKFPTFQWDLDKKTIQHEEDTATGVTIPFHSPAYLLYTSGSTGQPKGVVISHRALAHYIGWAKEHYLGESRPSVPLFTSIGFDLTITSLFLPTVSGGCMYIYEEGEKGPDLALLTVIEENAVDLIKLTPSHLALLRGRDLSHSRIRTMIVGGEDFKTDLARSIQEAMDPDLVIYNEYGPTEATVGCIVHAFQKEDDKQTSVPIGRPISNMRVYLLDTYHNPVPAGVTGELYLSGTGLADEYWNQPGQTRKQFVRSPFHPDVRLYRTGDLARLNPKGDLEFLGRKDQQVKIGGIRVELGEIESVLTRYPDLNEAVVVLKEGRNIDLQTGIDSCIRCGLPSNYPRAEFNSDGVCKLCRSFETYRQKARKYFKTMSDLRLLLADARSKNGSDYDCILLLSGGKDSTYALGQLVEMGLKVLAFTLDNGYISDQAKANIKRVVSELGVDHIFGTTPAMNAIFVDSLHRHSNVCNGCFKTLYTLSTQLALDKGIPFIVTGLSRGQFFETRLTEELFWNEEVDVAGIDQTILDARKTYHRTDDAVCRLLDVSMFEKDQVFEEVQFIDFYRYCDASLDELLHYLDHRLPWIRPTDTGRSTNCLINQVGIYVHKQERGYNNYAFPYSWDVRIGHKTREAALEEINETIDETAVKQIMNEIGYHSPASNASTPKQLVAYYVAPATVEPSQLREHLARYLPDYLVPTSFIALEKIPLTPNGKIDQRALAVLGNHRPATQTAYEPPGNQIEEMVAAIWSDVLQVDRVGIRDNFLDLGGNSLAAIRLMARLNETFELDLPLNRIFELPTISSLSSHIEEKILTMLDEISEE